MGRVVHASLEKGKGLRMQAEVMWSLLSSCQAHLPVGSMCSMLGAQPSPCFHPRLLPARAGCPGPSCAKSPCARSCFPAGTDSLGDEKSYISKSSTPYTSSSHLAAHGPRTACSHMLTALVPKDHGDGDSPCHGNHHRGTQHLPSPGNVPAPLQTGLENSRVLAGKKPKCYLLRRSCVKAPEGYPGESTPTLGSCNDFIFPSNTPRGKAKAGPATTTPLGTKPLSSSYSNITGGHQISEPRV